MAYTTINKSLDYFNTKLYTGNGSTSHGITGVGFKPDLTWIKCRSVDESNVLTDIVRGVTITTKSDITSGNQTISGGLKTFGTDGFTLGNDDAFNKNTATYASWNWKAGNSQGSSNTAGSINTTYTSVNTTAGFSISSYTGTGSNATIGHGLGAVPKMIIIKKLNASADWMVYNHSLGNNKYLSLNTTAAEDTGHWNSTSPTATVFSIGTDQRVNQSSATYIAYCFAEKQGYSKFESYTGTGNADGPFIYTGFKPAFVLIKVSSTTNDWEIHDNKRGPSNVINAILQPNLSAAESTSGREIDFLSNGFKLRNGSSQNNNSGSTFIYMAFGQSLVGTNNVPCTAR